MNNFFNSKKQKNFFLSNGSPFLHDKNQNTPVPPPMNDHWVTEDGDRVVTEDGDNVLVV